MSKVLILGCGYLGSVFADLLLSNSFKVVAARRDISSLPKKYNPVALDFLNLDNFNLLEKDFDYIVYMASAGSYEKSAYKETYYTGLKNSLNFAKCLASLKKFIFVSSTGVYPNQDGGFVTETTKRLSLDSESPSVELVKGEDLLLNLEANFKTSIIRFSGIYGEKRLRLINNIKSSTFKLNKNSENFYTNRIHVKDCANALLHLLKVSNLENIYIGSDNQPVTQKEVYTYIANLLNVDLLKSSNDLGSGRYGSKKCDNSLLKSSGFTFTYPTYKEGYKKIIEGIC